MIMFSENDNIYDWISCLIDKKLYFGPYPNQLMMNRLMDENFTMIVNLTEIHEEPLYDKNRDVKIVYFPIKDNSIPVDIHSYCSFITRLKYEYLNGSKIYIHCRGGHGRSGMVSVSLIYSIMPYDLRQAIDFVNLSHHNRSNLRIKWKKRKSPFNYDQFLFLSKLHKNIYVNMDHYNKYYNWLFYKEPFTVDEKTYESPYELYIDESLDPIKKFLSIYLFFMKNLGECDNIKDKLEMTYLKKFVLSDCENKDFCDVYNSIINNIREYMCCYNCYNEINENINIY